MWSDVPSAPLSVNSEVAYCGTTRTGSLATRPNPCVATPMPTTPFMAAVHSLSAASANAPDSGAAAVAAVTIAGTFAGEMFADISAL